MANFVLDKGYEADSDSFSSGVVRHRFVAQGTTGNDVILTQDNGALSVGVVMENVDAEKVTARPGQVVVNVRLLGIAPVELGTGGASAGSLVVSDTGGTAITGTSGDFVGGIALQTGVSGDIINVLLTPGVTVP